MNLQLWMVYSDDDKSGFDGTQCHLNPNDVKDYLLTLFLVLLTSTSFWGNGQIGTKFVLLHSLPQAGLDDLLKRIYEICKSQVNRRYSPSSPTLLIPLISFSFPHSQLCSHLSLRTTE